MADREYAPPGSPEWQRRLIDFMLDPEPAVWWWLSFATDAGSLGVTIIQAPNLVAAAWVARALDANPGGEVAGYQLPYPPKAAYRNRLLPPDEARRLSEMNGYGWMEVPADG